MTIQYNKLHPEPKQGKSLDIALKKVKHRLVETMSSSTADAFGLSRAILCNDSLVKKLDDLTRAEDKYRALIDHAKLVFKAFFDLIQVYKSGYPVNILVFEFLLKIRTSNLLQSYWSKFIL